MTKHAEWEFVIHEGSASIWRLKVHAGWLVKNKIKVNVDQYTIIAISESICFYPDPKHKWEVG